MNALCPGFCGVESKRSGVGKAVQHTLPTAEPCNGTAVVFLVKEKPGFLPVLKINGIFNPIFDNAGLIFR